jgi:D-proline reductase (dithiol) PrdB
MVSSAALHRRGEPAFSAGSPEFRTLPAALPPSELLMSHISINFDRTGFVRDINVAYPIDRLHELADEGVIGGVADTHFSVMGSTDPKLMEETADSLAARMRRDAIDAVLLCPV